MWKNVGKGKSVTFLFKKWIFTYDPKEVSVWRPLLVLYSKIIVNNNDIVLYSKIIVNNNDINYNSINAIRYPYDYLQIPSSLTLLKIWFISHDYYNWFCRWKYWSTQRHDNLLKVTHSEWTSLDPNSVSLSPKSVLSAIRKQVIN